jgi:hypothetical protein
MISFSIDKQRGQVNVEWMSRPVDSLKKSNKRSTARLGLDIHGTVTYFCFSTEKKLLRGPIFRGAYSRYRLCFFSGALPKPRPVPDTKR